MIRHTVLFTVKPNISKQEIDTIFHEVLALKNKLPNILSIMGGACDFHETIKERAMNIFTHGFSIDFKDQNALDTFFNDPITHPVKEKIINAAVGGYDGIFGFNFNS